jgi:hypothetical protein
MKDADRFAGFIGEFDTELDRIKATKDSKLAKLFKYYQIDSKFI